MEMLGSYGFIASGDVAPFHMRLTGALNGQKTGVFSDCNVIYQRESPLLKEKGICLFH